jgi:dGTP triphosphohydrolase
MAPASCNATSHFDSPAKIAYPQPHRARRIADDIAGMTDRYALQEHARYFEQTPELR